MIASKKGYPLNSQRLVLLSDFSRLLETVGNLDIDNHETSRHQSEEIDKLLGFNIPEIEIKLLNEAKAKSPDGNVQSWGAAIHQGNQTWVGLWHQTLQTPYSEIKLICDHLQPSKDSLLVDLGAGYGRLGIVLHYLYPGSKFYGIEYVQERVIEGVKILKELDCKNAKLVQGDLTSEDFILPEADYYFLYDYGTVMHIRQTLKQIERMADHKKFKVIARGKGVISLIESEHPWLSKVFAVIREENFNIYSTSDT